MHLRARVIALLTAGAMSAVPLAPAAATPGGQPAPAAEVAPGELLVKWAPGASANARAAERSRHGLEGTGRPVVAGYEQLRMDAGKDPRAVAADLARRGAVAAAQPNFMYRPATAPVNDPDWSRLWGLHQTSDVDLDVPEAWTTQRGSSSVVVAVIDTGVEVAHPDLAANLWVNPDEVAGDGIDNDGNGKIDDIHGWDFANGDASLYHGAEDDHGTHIAGTIAATADNGVGVAGVAPGVRIMSLKFMGSNKTGSTAKAMEAIAYAKAKGARVINASWGYPGDGDTAMRDAIRGSNAVFVAAAGNGGSDWLGDNNDTTPFSPASLDAANIIAVAAVESDGALAPYSNYGATSVDVGAPGSSIWSTKPGGTYGNMSGTSMAAPHVAGVAALLVSASPNLTVTDIVGLVKSAAVASPLTSLSNKTVTGGMPNARAAIDRVPTPLWPHAAAITTSGVTDTGFTLSWPAASDDVAVTDYLVTVGDTAEVAVTGTSHTASGLTEGKTYAASVRPRDADGNVGAPLTTSVTTATASPAWPAGAALTGSDVTASGFKASWPAASDDVGVDHYRVTVGDAAAVTVAGDTTSHTVTGLAEATDHSVAVAAVDVDGRTSPTLTTTIRTLSSSPAWPQGAAVSASSVTSTGFTLSWPAATDDVAVTGYGVTVGSAAEVVVTDRSLVVDGLTASTSYPVSVVARDADGKKSSALTTTVTTSAPPSTGGGGFGGGGGGGGGGGSAPAPAPTAPAEPTEEPVEEEQTSEAEPVVYDGTVARDLDLACPTIPPSGWTDVPSTSPHATGIGCATSWGVFIGGSGSTFSPETRLSRGQLASVLARAIEQATGSQLAAGTNQFADDDASVHAPAIDKLAAIGIVGGIDATTYAPTAPVTRAQFAAMLGRSYRHLVGTIPAGGDVFRDDDGNPHEAAINALAGLGIVTGDGRGSYLPGAVLTRAQSATMVSRLIDALVEAGAAG